MGVVRDPTNLESVEPHEHRNEEAIPRAAIPSFFGALVWGRRKRRTTRNIGVGLDYYWAADETVRTSVRCLHWYSRSGSRELLHRCAAPGTRYARYLPWRCRYKDTVHVRRDGQRHCSRGSVPSLRRHRSAYL